MNNCCNNRDSMERLVTDKNGNKVFICSICHTIWIRYEVDGYKWSSIYSPNTA